MKTYLPPLAFTAALLIGGFNSVAQVPFQYVVESNGAITINDYTGPGGKVEIPGSIDGSPVTSIGDSAFAWSADLTSVTIPGSVTTIGRFAFSYCARLTEIVVENSNTRYASLEGVLFNHNRTTLLQFPGGKSGSYTVPNTVTTIEAMAFSHCFGLTHVTMPNSVTSIGAHAFAFCTGLTSVTIPNSVSSIGGNAFGYCASLTSVAIPNSVKTIEDWTFSYCTGLMSVTIPNGVTRIGGGAFAGCVSLRNVSIPSTVTNIGLRAFSSGCTNLTEIVVEPSNARYASVEGVLFDKNRTTLIQYPGGKFGSYAIPESVTTLGEGAFNDCAGLTSVTIPNSAVSYNGFDRCPHLTEIIMSPSHPRYASLDGVVFDKNRTTLVEYPEGRPGSYAIPDGVATIEVAAFSGCAALTSVTIPKTVTSISGGAFDRCPRLTEIVVEPPNAHYSSVAGILFDKSGTALIRWPGGKSGNSTIPDGVTTIKTGAFDHNGGISLIIPKSITTIEARAFVNCTIALYFQGARPVIQGSLSGPFYIVTVYHLPGTDGWEGGGHGSPTELWRPRAQATLPPPWAPAQPFGFTVFWASGRVIVVEAATDLTLPVWTPVSTHTIGPDGTAAFTDHNWSSHPARYYRLRVP